MPIWRQNNIFGDVRYGFFATLLFIFGCLAAGDLCAQSIRVDADDIAVRDLLLSVRDQAGVDIVFSENLVADQRASCRFEGTDVDAALECVLRATGLRAERVRRKQYVVVASGLSATPPEPSRANLSGFVADASSGEVLPGAHVYLPDLKIGTATNAAGYFALPALPVREYVVRVSYLGFQTTDLRLSPGTPSLRVQLHPTTLESDAIVVEDDESNLADLRSIPGLLAQPVRRLEELPSFPGEADLFQALQWYPGIRKSGEVNGGLVIRGASPDQNLYLLDGAPVYHPWHAFSLISTFQTETFKNIRLYRDAFPSQYGGRLAAVLDAQMKDGTRENPTAMVALSALSGRFVIETPATRNSSFMLAGRRSYLDKLIGREHPVEGTDGRRDTLRTGYFFYDASAKYTWRPSERDRLSISFYNGGDDLDLRLPFELSLDFSSWLRPADLFFEIAHRWNNRLFSARYQHLHSDRLFVTTTAYLSSYQARETTFLRPTSTAALTSDYRVDLRDLGVKVDIDFYQSLTHQLQVGAHVVLRDFDSSLDSEVRRSAGSIDEIQQQSISSDPEIAVYAQDAWKPGRDWTLTPGLRLSFFGAGSYAYASPSISVQYVVDPTYLILRAGAGQHVQYLHRLRDRFAFTYDLVSSRWIPAGDDVRPSTSVHVSGGFESRLLPGLLITGDAYVRDVDDVLVPEDESRSKDGLIGPGIDVAALLGQYVSGDARAYGVEIGAQIRNGPWNISLSYAGSKSLMRSLVLGEESLRPSPFDVPISARGVVSRVAGKWDFTWSFELRSGYPVTVPVAQYVVGDPLEDEDRYLHRPEINNGRLPAYVRADLSAQRRFRLLGGRWLVGLHLYNAMNRRNIIARQYVPVERGVDVQNRRGLPILPLFELQMEL